VKRLPKVGTGIRERPVGVDRVLTLQLLRRVVGLRVVEDDVVERLEAQCKVVFGVHPFQRGQEGVVDLSEIAESRPRGAEP
jgi:hypothetical protein